jgi:hypothetical protein
MMMTAVKRWGPGAVLAAIALWTSASAPGVECLDPPPPELVPPPEAFAACRSSAEDAACEVVLPDLDLTVAGLCAATPGAGLFCRPFTPPPPPPPPPETFDACAGLTLGEACGIPLPCGLVRGTCDATLAGELFCRPPFAPRF